MPFIQSSTVTNKTVQSTPVAGSDAVLVNGQVYNSSGLLVNTRFNEITDAVNRGTGTSRSTLGGSNNPTNTNSLTSLIQSALGTFEKGVGGLAKTVDQKLSGLFNNSNNPRESTVTTQISDPLTTNFLKNKRPEATSFRIDGFTSGSTPIVGTGSVTTQGSQYSLMTGTQLGTMLNRFKTDIATVKSLPAMITNKFTNDALTSLFGKTTGGLTQSVGRSTTDPLFGSVLSLSSSSGISQALGINPLSSTNLAFGNDYNGFMGDVGSLSSLLGDQNLSQYYQGNSTYSLMDASGNFIDTNQSGVDSETANSLTELIRSVGCAITVDEFRSVNRQASIFNIGLLLASLKGMTGLTSDLLNCNYARTSMGQQSITTTFEEVAPYDPNMGLTLINNIDAPLTIEVRDDFYIDMLSNPELSNKNFSSLDSIFTIMGTSPKKAMAVSGASSDAYPVYDTSWIGNVSPSIMNRTFGDNTLSDFFAGQIVGVKSDGTLGLL